MGVSSRAAGKIDAGGVAGMTWQRARTRSEERAARQLEAAEREAEAAAARYRALKEAASTPVPADAVWRPLPTWQQMLLLVVGGGILTGLAIMWLLATAFLGPLSLLALPAAAGIPAAPPARGGPGARRPGDARGRGEARTAAPGVSVTGGTGRPPDTMS